MKKLNKKYLFLSIIISIFIIAIVFITNKTYPFGHNIFAVQDFDHAYIPVYYKLWDVLHNQSSLLFDWNLGVGLNCFGSLIGNSLLSPTSWLIALFKRDFIPYAMSFIIVIKIIEVTIITYWSIDKMFNKVDDIYKMIFTITYTFCGWTAFMISSFLYLDVFALFPLFVFAFYRLLKDNKWGMYIIVLTLCLMFSYYMSYLILFFIIGTMVISTIVLDIKDKKKKVVEVLLLTLLSLGLSCIVFLPAFYLAKTSTRMAASALFDNSFNISETLLKVVYMLPMSLPFYLTFKQLKNKKDKKNNLFFGLLLLYLLIGIIIPEINAMWHTGSYSGLPFRYSFIPSYVLILISLYYLENNKEKKIKAKNNNLVYYLCYSFSLVLLMVLAYVYRKEYINSIFIFGLETLSQFICVLILFIISIVIISIAFKTKKNILLLLFSIIYLSIFNIYFIRVDTNDQLSLRTEEVKENLKLPQDGYNYLIDMRDISINAPYILKVPSIQNRIHFIKKEMVDFSNNLGYQKEDTHIFAHGGNQFINLIKLNKYVLTYNNMDEDLYEQIDSYKNYKLYASKYNLSYIIPYDAKIYNAEGNSMVDNTNNIYKKVFNQEKDIIHLVNKEEIKLSKDNIYYFESTYNNLEAIIEQLPEDEYELDIAQNDDFIIMSLRVFKDIKIIASSKEYIVSYINKEELIEFINNNQEDVSFKEKGNKRIYNYNNKNNHKNALIPVNYDDNYNITINKKTVKYQANIYNFVSVPLEKGNNKIEIKYIPKFLKEGAMISICSLLILLFFYITNKKIKYLDKTNIINPLYWLTCLIGIVFILKIYILFWL